MNLSPIFLFSFVSGNSLTVFTSESLIVVQCVLFSAEHVSEHVCVKMLCNLLWLMCWRTVAYLCRSNLAFSLGT